jgi:hypothetical protein
MTHPSLPPVLEETDDDFPPGFPTTAERNWAVLAHLGGFGLYLIPTLGHLLVPLAVWLAKRRDSTFVEENAREALNFQISLTLYAIGAGLLTVILIGWLILAALAVFQFVLMVIASVRASHGEIYRYPLTLRLL